MTFASVDYYFNYNNVIRFLLIQKTAELISNLYNIPFIDRLMIFICMHRISDVDDISISNYSYLFKFFFGKKIFFTRLKNEITFNSSFYSFDVKVVFTNREVFYPIFFLLNDIFPFLPSNQRGMSFVGNVKMSLLLIDIYDLNIFTEKKTNAGLFKLDKVLHYKIFLSGGFIEWNDMLFNLLKII